MVITTDYDIRQIPVRLVGYAMAFSEALKYSFPSSRFRAFARGVTIGYAVFDMMVKTTEAKKHGNKKAIITATDVFLWQSGASIILPTMAVNQVCWVARTFTSNLRPPLANLFTSSIGLSIIPAFIEPIDYAVDYVLDGTFRKYIKAD